MALGGNALLKRGEALNIINQRNNIAEGISSLSDILKNNTITFVHGNGPQVGLLALQGAAYKKETGTDTMDLDVLDAETEGMNDWIRLSKKLMLLSAKKVGNEVLLLCLVKSSWTQMMKHLAILQ